MLFKDRGGVLSEKIQKKLCKKKVSQPEKFLTRFVPENLFNSKQYLFGFLDIRSWMSKNVIDVLRSPEIFFQKGLQK